MRDLETYIPSLSCILNSWMSSSCSCSNKTRRRRAGEKFLIHILLNLNVTVKDVTTSYFTLSSLLQEIGVCKSLTLEIWVDNLIWMPGSFRSPSRRNIHEKRHCRCCSLHFISHQFCFRKRRQSQDNNVVSVNSLWGNL